MSLTRCRGIWDGAVVALKVYSHVGSLGSGSNALLQRSPSTNSSSSSIPAPPSITTSIPAILDTHAALRHPCIVKIYMHATRQVPGSDPPTWETWILSELCNRGSLSEVVTRGLCNNVSQASHVKDLSGDDGGAPHMTTILAIAKGVSSNAAGAALPCLWFRVAGNAFGRTLSRFRFQTGSVRKIQGASTA